MGICPCLDGLFGERSRRREERRLFAGEPSRRLHLALSLLSPRPKMGTSMRVVVVHIQDDFRE